MIYGYVVIWMVNKMETKLKLYIKGNGDVEIVLEDNHTHNSYPDWYKQGFDDGVKKGYSDGVSNITSSHQDGFESGYAEGYNDGIKRRCGW